MHACVLRQMPRSNNRHREPLIITIEVVLSDSSSNNVLITGNFAHTYILRSIELGDVGKTSTTMNQRT